MANRLWMVAGLGLLIGMVVAPAFAWGAGPTFDVDNPPQGVFSDEWLEVSLLGGKIGYAHSTMRREGSLIHTQNRVTVSLERVGQAITITQLQACTETLDGQPRSFRSEMELSAMKTVLSGTIKDGKVIVEQRQGDIAMPTKEYDYPKGALMAWGLYRAQDEKGFEPGTMYTLPTYVPDMLLDRAVEAQVEVGERETFTLRGKSAVGQKVTSKMVLPQGSFEMIAWIDKQGLPIKSIMPMPGLGDFVLTRADEKTALADFVPPEFFMETTIAVDPIDFQNVDKIKFRVRVAGAPDQAKSIPETGMQKVVEVQGDAATVEVHRQKHTPNSGAKRFAAGGSARAVPKELADYLDSNLMMSLEDPQLRKLAERARDGAEDPFVIADNLRKFVTKYVEKKDLTIGFASANEVCRNQAGDCSEHAVLLAALGRICGLPSRVVTGLAYVPLFGNKDDIFGYHLWTEFWIDGTWYGVDAAIPETQPNPARIAFAVSSLADSGLADLSISLLHKIGMVSIEVVEIDGKAKK
jgi:hypothetical protein